MSSYLGSLGRLVPLRCASSQSTAHAEAYAFESTLEGKVKGQMIPGRGRTWSLSTSDATRFEDQATLADFLSGAWGRGPFVFVSEDAAVSNLLTPRSSLSDPAVLDASAVASGPAVIDGVWVPRTVRRGNDPDIRLTTERIPVIPGLPVTASAYALGTEARLRISFYNQAGERIALTTSPFTEAPADWTRLQASRVAPEGAVDCQIFGVAGTEFARPAVTWTADLLPWAPGEGCLKAVVHGASRNLIMASQRPLGGRYASLSYTVTEVG